MDYRKTPGKGCVRDGIYFTPRERDVLEGLALGLANKEIAARGGIVEGTVKVYTHRLFDKLAPLGLDNRVKLALWWRDVSLRQSDAPSGPE